jgi:DNA-binding NtrC family response regulator
MEDLATYIAFFTAKYCRKNQREVMSIAPDALRIMEGYPWPGNLRELENVIERAVILSPGSEITAKVLPPELHEETEAGVPLLSLPRGMRMEEIELMVIQEVLRHNHGDRARSAEELGIGVRTLYRKLSEMQTRDPEALA